MDANRTIPEMAVMANALNRLICVYASFVWTLLAVRSSPLRSLPCECAELYPVGGRGGIRTHGGLAPTAVFKTAAFNHSATRPLAAAS